MKILIYIIAVLCFILAFIMWSMVGRFTDLYEAVGAELPSVTRALVGTWSWLPAGALVVIGILIVISVIRGSARSSYILAVVGMICGMVVVIITALILYLPLRHLSDDTDVGAVYEDKKSGRTSRCIRPLTGSESGA